MLSTVCTRAQVQRLEESRLTIRAAGDQDRVAYEEVYRSLFILDKARHLVPIVLSVLLDRVQRLRNDLFKAVKGQSARPIVIWMIAGSY